MEYFNNFVSNTSAASGIRCMFESEDENKSQKGRLFYKIQKDGKFKYSFLFSNTIDSEYNQDFITGTNKICDEWLLENARATICDDCNCEKMVSLSNFINLTFDQRISKMVQPGELFFSDEVVLDAKKGQYLCLEITFRGKLIPFHGFGIIPTFKFIGGKWIPSNQMPFPSMIGCQRNVEKKIAFLGDSITEGLGTAPNTYTHWCARIADMLGDENSYWNLGLGCGRAKDAATDGIWLYKARQNDIVFVCFGVNDILKGSSEQELKDNLKFIVEELKKCNIKVILQTVPPFGYDDEKTEIWNNVNNYILKDLSKCCDYVFDNTDILGDQEKGKQFAKYGGHPNGIGCEKWAEGLYEFIKDKI